MTLNEVQQTASRRYEELNLAGRIGRDGFIAGFIDCWRLNSPNTEANTLEPVRELPSNETIIDAEIEGIKNNKINWQLIQLETGYNNSQIENELEMFKLQCLAEQTIHSNIIEAGRHFRMWINKRKMININNNGNSINKRGDLDEWRQNITEDMFRRFS